MFLLYFLIYYSNQEIFKQIRSVMDNASRSYRESKGLEEIELRRQEEQMKNDSINQKTSPP